MKPIAYYTRLSLCALIATPLLLSGCKKDELSQNEQTNDRLVGEWRVTSFTKDGEELVGAGISAFDMEYKKEGETIGEGEWDVVYADGSTLRPSEDYAIKDDGKTFDFDDTEYEIEVTDSRLELGGNDGGFRYEIRAKRD